MSPIHLFVRASNNIIEHIRGTLYLPNKETIEDETGVEKRDVIPGSLSSPGGEVERERRGKGREIGMLVSESHPLTPVFRRIVQSITPPSLSRIIISGEARSAI